MLTEMPRCHWCNLPEAGRIDRLIASATARARDMVKSAAANPNRNPNRPTPRAGVDAAPAEGLPAIRSDARECRRCPLWQAATQTVFGEGPADAVLMLVGEQPGDQEDLAGRPFVGPAGQVLDAALAAAGIDRAAVYLTNAVKHFKFTPRGKRRIHQRPDGGEIEACRWWLARELAAVRPRLVVALGATAAHALLGRPMAIGRNRGRPIPTGDGAPVLITVHPSYILRVPDAGARERERMALVADLKAAATVVR